MSEGAGQAECTQGKELGKDASGNPVFADVGLVLISSRLKGLGIEVHVFVQAN